MPYTIKSADGTERDYKLEDIVTGVAAGDLCHDWLVRRVGDEGWMSVKTLLRVRDDGSRAVVLDKESVTETPFPTAEAHPQESVSHQDIGPILFQPSITQVGGWLIVLILWFGFWIPLGVQGDAGTIQRNFAPVVGQHPSMHVLSSICTLLLWTSGIVSVYCAYVLAFRKPGAPLVAKRGLVFIMVLQLSLNGIALLLAQPPLSKIPFGVLVKPLIWLAIWYSYLIRSKRVKETYVA